MQFLFFLTGGGFITAGLLAWTGAWRSWIGGRFVGNAIFSGVPLGIAIILMSIGPRPVVWVGIAIFIVGVALNIWTPHVLEPSWYRAHPRHGRHKLPDPPRVRTGIPKRVVDGFDYSSRASLIDAEPPVADGGPRSAKPISGRLLLTAVDLIFTESWLSQQARGTELRLRIPLRQIARVAIEPGAVGESDPSRALPERRTRSRLLVATAEHRYLLSVPRIELWESAIAQRQRMGTRGRSEGGAGAVPPS